MSDALIKTIITCIFWVVAYFIVLYLTNKAGVGYNVLKNSLKMLTMLKKQCTMLKAQLKTRGFSTQSKSTLKTLKKIVAREKLITRILNVYLFDNKGDKLISNARKLVEEVPECCRKAVAIAAEGKNGDIDTVFSQISSNIEKTNLLVKHAIKRDMKEALLKV